MAEWSNHRPREKPVNGDETDAVSRYWRHRVRWGRGELRKIKRKINRRERRQGRAEAWLHALGEVDGQ